MSQELSAGSSRTEEAAISSELRAVLACARAVVNREELAGFRAALGACTDAERLCEVAVAQGMLGHLHLLATEQPAVDLAIVRRLVELQRISAQRSLYQSAYLLRLLEELGKIGVEAMPYKGPAGAQYLYGDIALRSWSDLDLLVHYEQVAAARKALLAGGLADANDHNAVILQRRRRGWGEVAFNSANGEVQVEIHWEVTVGFTPRPLRAELLFARAGRLELLGREVLCPSPVDLLLVTCLNGTKDRWNNVEGLLGLAVQVRSTPPDSWPDLVATARSAGCARRVAVGVAHACRVLGQPTPPEVVEIIARDHVAGRLARSLKLDLLREGSSRSPRGQLALILWRFASEDSLALGAWHALARLFLPGPEDWESLRLPGYAKWLYYPLRPARLVVKWARRM